MVGIFLRYYCISMCTYKGNKCNRSCVWYIIYATDMKAWITGAGLDTWIIYCKMFFSVILCIPAFILAIINKNKYCAGYYLLVGAMENYLFCTGAIYQHYAIIRSGCDWYGIYWRRHFKQSKCLPE